MEILNKDEIGPWSMEVGCECGAHLKVYAEDFRQWGSEDGYKVAVTCARCRKIIYVDDAPAIVWETAE